MPCIPIPAQCGSGPFGGNAIEIRPGVNADHINWLSDTHAGVHCKPIPALLIRSFRGATAYGWLKGNTAITPLLTHWSYCSLVLSHRFKVNLISMHFIDSDYLNSMYTHTCLLWIRSLDGQYYIKSTRYHIINDTILFSGNKWFIIWRKYKYPQIRWLIYSYTPIQFFIT